MRSMLRGGRSEAKIDVYRRRGHTQELRARKRKGGSRTFAEDGREVKRQKLVYWRVILYSFFGGVVVVL